MSWILYLFGSGQAIFLAAAMILAAVTLLPRVAGWRAKGVAVLALTGLSVAVVSAAPLSYWLYATAIGSTGVWLGRQRRDGAKPLPPGLAAAPSTRPPSLSRTRAWRYATAAIWIGIVLLELPHQLAPSLPPLNNSPLYVIGDSVTAGMGGSDERTWTSLMPDQIAVHNLARPGATTADALKHQAPQIPANVRLVLVEIGGNDLLGGTPAAEFERNLDALLASVSRSPDSTASQPTVVMFELPLPPLCNEYGRIQRRLAARYGVHLIPKRVLISILTGQQSTLDSIHLSNGGHQQMADAVWGVVGSAYDSPR